MAQRRNGTTAQWRSGAMAQEGIIAAILVFYYYPLSCFPQGGNDSSVPGH